MNIVNQGMVIQSKQYFGIDNVNSTIYIHIHCIYISISSVGKTEIETHGSVSHFLSDKVLPKHKTPISRNHFITCNRETIFNDTEMST